VRGKVRFGGMKKLVLLLSILLLLNTCFASDKSHWYTVIDTSGQFIGKFRFSPSPVDILNSSFAKKFEPETFALSFILRFHFLSDSMTIVYSGLKEYNNVVKNETLNEMEMLLEKEVKIFRKNKDSKAWHRFYKLNGGDEYMLEERYCYLNNGFILSPLLPSGLQPDCP
jgi:hypothetical protein